MGEVKLAAGRRDDVLRRRVMFCNRGGGIVEKFCRWKGALGVLAQYHHSDAMRRDDLRKLAEDRKVNIITYWPLDPEHQQLRSRIF